MPYHGDTSACKAVHVQWFMWLLQLSSIITRQERCKMFIRVAQKTNFWNFDLYILLPIPRIHFHLQGIPK